MVNTSRLVHEFLTMVQIDSPSRQERAMADWYKARLIELGLTVEEDEAGKAINGTAGNLIARLPGDGQGMPIFFSAHLDTVEPGRGIRPLIEGDIIRSAGDTILGGDDKAGLAAILEAIRIIKENNLPHGEIELVITVAEECGLLGAKQLHRQQLQSVAGFVLDAGGPVGSIVVRGPAQTKIEATIRGKAAHAGVEPEKGISAIQVAARAIDRMPLGRIDAETTANIGVIEGGKATNIIPDMVNLKGEARSLDPRKLHAQTKQMTTILEQTAQEFGAYVQLRVEDLYPEINLKPEEPVVQIASQAIRSCGLTPSLDSTGGGSDANIFIGLGLPTANLGIGMQNVHSVEEKMAISDLVKLTEVVLAIVKTAHDWR
ncbi:MAG: M20/M25/M40 family metallo-hydrolase [Bacillota bacterium]